MIRRATSEDIVGIGRLCEQLGGLEDAPALPARLDRLLDAPAHAIFVAEGDEGLEGFAAAEHRVLLQFGERIELIALVVDESARRHGRGQQLVAAVEAWAARRGVAQLVVRSNIVRDAAHVFYPQLGYTHQKTQHVYVKSLR